MLRDLAKVLVTEEEIKKIVTKVATRIENDYKDKELVMIGILKGGAPFMMDLIKQINLPLVIDFIRVESYFGGTTQGELIFRKDIEVDIANKHVLIVDDIIDSSRTLKMVIDLFKKRNASSIEVCTLLDKPSGRKIEYTPKYIGTTVGNEFVVGYGLDYDEKYRNLPVVGVLKEEVYKK
ncbi:MAG: Hypoxanthine-guanine phosphoribosyltransferase [Tenericutes bacterium ADurb.Bin087]|nr:MAG: Hypoxanthine-guanine phosphoribosyltransferase [Tenericutes bacterium ADurb.Bin087]